MLVARTANMPMHTSGIQHKEANLSKMEDINKREAALFLEVDRLLSSKQVPITLLNAIKFELVRFSNFEFDIELSDDLKLLLGISIRFDFRLKQMHLLYTLNRLRPNLIDKSLSLFHKTVNEINKEFDYPSKGIVLKKGSVLLIEMLFSE